MAASAFAPLQNLLALAYVIEERIRTGALPNHAAAARWLGVTTARISQIVGLTLLAPAIQEWILCATPGEVASLRERYARPIAAQPSWERQMRTLRQGIADDDYCIS